MSPRIAHIETRRFVYPVEGHFKFFEQPGGGAPGRPTVLVKISTEDGHCGWGQSVPSPRWSYETVDTVESTIERFLAPELIGRDPFDLAAIHSVMNTAIAPSFSTGQPIAKAAIDTALHDLNGRVTGQPVAEHLAQGKPVRSNIRLSWTLNPACFDDVPPDIERARALGYRSFNVKVGGVPAADIDLCRLVRELAPDAFLWVDANGGYAESDVLPVARELATLGYAALEQPLPANRLTGYQRLKRLAALPILMDEGVLSHVDLEEFAQLKLLDGVAMKVSRCGGLLEAARIMQVIRQHGLLFFGSGLTDPDLSLAASLAFFGAFQLEHPAALNAPQFLSTTVLRQPLPVIEGCLQVPSGPGLGVDVDEDRLRGA